MIMETSISELVSFLTAVFFAAVASASVRGMSDGSGSPLASFHKFYLDLSTALVALALLNVGGTGPWAMNGTWALSSSQLSLFLPMAIVLLLLALALSRHKWVGRRNRRTMDLIATVVFVALVVVAAFMGTSKASASERLDAVANRLFGTYCSDDSTDETAAAKFLATLVPTSKLRNRQRQHDEPATLIPHPPSVSLTSEVSTRKHTRKSGRKQRNPKVEIREAAPQDLCIALETYIAIRSAGENDYGSQALR